jgi:hypothetical protein
MVRQRRLQLVVQNMSVLSENVYYLSEKWSLEMPRNRVSALLSRAFKGRSQPSATLAHFHIRESRGERGLLFPTLLEGIFLLLERTHERTLPPKHGVAAHLDGVARRVGDVFRFRHRQCRFFPR